MKKILFAIALLFSVNTFAADAVTDGSSIMEGKPFAIRFYADWCPKCKQLDAKLNQIKPDFTDKINFVVLDVTDDESTQIAWRKAKELGLEKIAKENGRRTGILVLANPEGYRILMLNQTASEDVLRTSLERLAATAAD